MCGIGGIFDLNDNSEISLSRLTQIGHALEHRGPDDEGFWCGPGTGFVHRRLMVIDPDNATQPMCTPEQDVCVVFNGMIYNYQTLKKQLITYGHNFRTNSDTEVILYGWRQWGIDLVKHLDGFFAISIYDDTTETLTLMRDRWGKKPLFYTIENNQLIFASDVPAIITAMSSQPDIRMDAFSDYITYGYVPEPKCIFEKVHKLLPAHTLQVVRYKQQNPVIQRYWRFRVDPQTNNRTIEDASEELTHLLDKAVQKRLISDVPLGAFLSGGLDSAAIVSTMTELKNNSVITCTMGFDDPKLDERELANITSEHYKTTHYTKCVRADDLSDIKNLVTGFGEPFADPSALPTAHVSKLARNHMTVALSGDGGDELFAGYRRYPFHLREEQIKNYIPANFRSTVFGALAKVYPRAHWAPRPFRAKATFEALANDTANGLLRATCITTNLDKKMLLKKSSFANEYQSVDMIKNYVLEADTDDILARAQYVDLMTWLPGRMLVKVDRASMLHGLEVRNPLLDIELAEWAARLPTHLKLEGFSGKRVLRYALAKKVPKEILTAPKKGFTPPIHYWMKYELRQRIDNLPSKDWVKKLLNPHVVQLFIDQQFRGIVDRKTTLWALLMFDVWYEKYIN